MTLAVAITMTKIPEAPATNNAVLFTPDTNY